MGRPSYYTDHEVMAVDKAAGHTKSSYHFDMSLCSGSVQRCVTHLYTITTDIYSNIQQLEIVPERVLVLFRPRTTLFRFGFGTFFVPEPDLAKHFR